MAKKKASKKKAGTKKSATKKGATKKAATKKSATKKSAPKKSSKKKSPGKKPGLWANIHKAQEREKRGGKKTRDKGEKGAPSDQAIEKAKDGSRKKK